MSRLMTKLTNYLGTQLRLRSAWASTQSDQSLHCPHEDTLGPQLPIKCTAKTLIRLGICPGWSESSLGAQIILMVLSYGGSNLNSVVLSYSKEPKRQTVQTLISEGFSSGWNCPNHVLRFVMVNRSHAEAWSLCFQQRKPVSCREWTSCTEILAPDLKEKLRYFRNKKDIILHYVCPISHDLAFLQVLALWQKIASSSRSLTQPQPFFRLQLKH